MLCYFYLKSIFEHRLSKHKSSKVYKTQIKYTLLIQSIVIELSEKRKWLSPRDFHVIGSTEERIIKTKKYI